MKQPKLFLVSAATLAVAVLAIGASVWLRARLENSRDATVPNGAEAPLEESASVVSDAEAELRAAALNSLVGPGDESQEVDPVALEAQAKAAMTRRAYDKARDSLVQLFNCESDGAERIRIGQMLYECLVRTHAYEEALKLGRELLALGPSSEVSLRLTQQLAALLHRMGRQTDAETLLREAIATEKDPGPKERLSAQLRGIWRHTAGRTDEVIADLEARIEQNPRDREALRTLGEIHLKSRRDHESALPVYEKLVELDPSNVRLETTLLGLYRKNRRFDGMRRIFEERLDKSGDGDPTLHLSIAQTELLAGRGDEAVQYAESHLAGEDATPFELQMLSTVYDKAGRDEAAVATLDTAIARATNDQQRVSMQFQKADMLVWDKKYAEAEALLRSIIETAGDDKQTLTRAKSEIVRIYEMQGKLSELNL